MKIFNNDHSLGHFLAVPLGRALGFLLRMFILLVCFIPILSWAFLARITTLSPSLCLLHSGALLSCLQLDDISLCHLLPSGISPLPGITEFTKVGDTGDLWGVLEFDIIGPSNNMDFQVAYDSSLIVDVVHANMTPINAKNIDYKQQSMSVVCYEKVESTYAYLCSCTSWFFCVRCGGYRALQGLRCKPYWLVTIRITIRD